MSILDSYASIGCELLKAIYWRFTHIWVFKFQDNIESNDLLRIHLTDRKFIISEGDIYSDTQLIEAGLPQIGILRPLMYLILTSYMPTNPSIHTISFADDTSLLSVQED